MNYLVSFQSVHLGFYGQVSIGVNTRPPTEVMVVFVDQHKEQYGVEPICRKIQIAPSSYYERKARERDPDRLPDRIKRDRELECAIQRVWENNFKAYGVNKVWRQLRREGVDVAPFND